MKSILHIQSGAKLIAKLGEVAVREECSAIRRPARGKIIKVPKRQMSDTKNLEKRGE